VRPVKNADGTVLKFERIIIGCGSTLFQDGKSIKDLTLKLLGDMVDSYNFILAGQECDGSDAREATVWDHHVEECSRDSAHQEFEGGPHPFAKDLPQMKLEDLIYGVCASISDHAEKSVIKNELAEEFEMMAKSRAKQLRYNFNIRFILTMQRLFGKGNLTANNRSVCDGIPTDGRYGNLMKKMVRNIYYGEPELDYKRLSKMVFFCDWREFIIDMSTMHRLALW